MANLNSGGRFTKLPRLDLWFAILLTATILLVYFPAMRGGFIWDDEAHVTRPDLRSLHGLWRIWFDLGATQQYYPLLHSAFWFEHRLWGDGVVGYHLLNIFFHVSSVFLLLEILRRLNIPGAWLAAAIFALHPLQAESVAWIAEQKNTLSGVFYLGAMLAYLRFDQDRRTLLYLVALGLFVLGLLTKTVTATLPGALLVICWWQHGRVSWRRDVVPVIPWFVLGGTAGLGTAWIERKFIGAQGVAFDMTFLHRLLLAGRVIWFYLGKLLWPAGLLFIYPRWEVNPSVWWQYLFTIAAVALVVVLWLIGRRWRGPLAGFLFFIGSLFPALGFLNVYSFQYSFVADHFQYLASLGIIVVVAAGIAETLARMQPRAYRLGQVLCVMLLGTLATLTWGQTGMYKNLETLYQTTLEGNPACWLCHNNLGIFLNENGRRREAIVQYEATLHIKPDDFFAHNNLGNALAREGLISAAMDHYEAALRLQPNYPEAHNNVGNVLLEAGQLSAAIYQYEEALRLKPNFADAQNGLGSALFLMGRVSEAREHYEAALHINPNHAMARQNLSQLLASRQKR
jgi:Tfp pilus assembly protein PilF